MHAIGSAHSWRAAKVRGSIVGFPREDLGYRKYVPLILEMPTSVQAGPSTCHSGTGEAMQHLKISKIVVSLHSGPCGWEVASSGRYVLDEDPDGFEKLARHAQRKSDMFQTLHSPQPGQAYRNFSIHSSSLGA